MTEEEKIICKSFLHDADNTHSCNEYKLLMELLEQGTAGIQAIYTEALEEGIRCAMCTNAMKSEKGCDGGCMVDTKMYNKVMAEINSRLLGQPPATPQEPNTWSLDDAREDFMHDVYNELDFLPTNEEANRIIDIFDRVTRSIEQEHKWIPVTERLPEPNRLVLCYITTGTIETYFLALWNDTLNAWEEGIGGYRLLENDLGYEVIAWMPLPEPYEGGE